MKDIFRGELVCLTAEEPEALASAEIRWQMDSEFHRLASDTPLLLMSEKRYKEKFEKEAESEFKPMRYSFSVRTLSDDKLIGSLGLWVDLIQRDAWVGLGIGNREFWNRGYGTDMMKVCLRYFFTELNMHRMTLGLFDFNLRALRSYEKAGFRVEGRTRGDLMREGRRFDSIWMGVLREEWEAMQTGVQS